MMSTRKGDGRSRNFPRVRVFYSFQIIDLLFIFAVGGGGVTELSFFVDFINV